MPDITGVLETSLYVADLERSQRFYQEVMGFRTMIGDSRFRALSVSDRQVLLLFRQGASLKDMTLPGGVIPGHDGSGTSHLAFAIEAAAWDEWREKLASNGVTIESTVRWERGGKSLYFRDPDSHLLELVTPGCWPIY